MAKIITITGTACRTGKTTLTANLAVAFATHYNKKVLCLDLNEEAGLSQWFQVSTTCKVYSTPFVPPEYPINIFHLKEMTEAITENLHLVRDWNSDDIFFRESLDQVVNDYDLILMDSPQGFGVPALRALAIADFILLTWGLNNLEASSKLDVFMANLQFWQHPKQLLRAVLSYPVDWKPTSIDEQPQLMVQQGERQLLPRLLKTKIWADTEYMKALAQKVPVAMYSPFSITVDEYQALAQEILRLLEMPLD
ncbi:MAG: ParA family protein [Blastocatellia bacterium]